MCLRAFILLSGYNNNRENKSVATKNLVRPVHFYIDIYDYVPVLIFLFREKIIHYTVLFCTLSHISLTKKENIQIVSTVVILKIIQMCSGECCQTKISPLVKNKSTYY